MGDEDLTKGALATQEPRRYGQAVDTHIRAVGSVSPVWIPRARSGWRSGRHRRRSSRRFPHSARQQPRGIQERHAQHDEVAPGRRVTEVKQEEALAREAELNISQELWRQL